MINRPPLRSAVFLDRDGVINGMVYNPEFGLIDSPQNPGEFRLLPGVPEAIRRINEAGFLAIVVSNQPGIAKGKCTSKILDEVTQKMHADISAEGGHLDAVYYCLHHPDAVIREYRVLCGCRKPKPGLLQTAAERFGIDLSTSFMVGDGLTDVLAGRAAGCRTVLLGEYRCDSCRLMTELEIRPDVICRSLAIAVTTICHEPFASRTIGPGAAPARDPLRADEAIASSHSRS